MSVGPVSSLILEDSGKPTQYSSSSKKNTATPVVYFGIPEDTSGKYTLSNPNYVDPLDAMCQKVMRENSALNHSARGRGSPLTKLEIYLSQLTDPDYEQLEGIPIDYSSPSKIAKEPDGTHVQLFLNRKGQDNTTKK